MATRVKCDFYSTRGKHCTANAKLAITLYVVRRGHNVHFNPIVRKTIKRCLEHRRGWALPPHRDAMPIEVAPL